MNEYSMESTEHWYFHHLGECHLIEIISGIRFSSDDSYFSFRTLFENKVWKINNMVQFRGAEWVWILAEDKVGYNGGFSSFSEGWD